MTAQSLTTGLVAALIGASLLIMPSLTRPTLQFGVRVPPTHTDAPVIASERRAYRVRLGVLVVVCVLAALLLPSWSGWLAGTLPLAELAAGLGCYLLARERIAAAKHAEGWFDGLTQTVVADTSWRTTPARFPTLWTLPAVAVIVATIALGAARYHGLPARLAVHFTTSGQPDRWVDRSPLAAFSLCVTQVVVTGLIVGLMLLTYRARPDLDAADPAGSARRYRVFLTVTARALLVFAALTDVTMLLGSLTVWQAWRPTGAAVLLLPLPTLLGLVGLLAMLARTGQAGTRLAAGARPTGPAPAGGVQRDDDRYWKGGLVYVNRDDPALMVAKRFGVGWTVNFGNPRSWLLLAAIIVVTVAVPIATSRR